MEASRPNIPACVVAHYLIREAASKVAQEKTASRRPHGLTAAVLTEFGLASLDTVANGRMTIASVTNKLRELISLFSKAPDAWEAFKKMIGASSIASIPGKVAELMRGAGTAMRAVGEALAETVPALKIYLGLGAKLPAIGDWLNNLYDKLPSGVRTTVTKLSAKVRTLADWVDQIVRKNNVSKVVGRAASAAIFAYVWMNVAELSWNVPEILRGFSGQLSFVELLDTFPESGIGLLVSLLFPGIPQALIFNVFLPVTVAVRLAYLYERKLLKVEGRRITLSAGGQTYQFTV